LTLQASPTNLKRMGKSGINVSRQGRRGRCAWQIGVCLLLIGLVLYNPFLVLAHLTDGLAYETLARHRATVGSSEMQHFAPVQGAQFVATVEEVVSSLTVEKSECSSHSLHDEALPERPELLASTWFRPPPTR